MDTFGESFSTLKVSDLKLPDQAWHSNDLFRYVERLVNKLGIGILDVQTNPSASTVNGTRKPRSTTKESIPDASKDKNPLELPLNKTGTQFSGTVS